MDHETAIIEMTVTGSWGRPLWQQAHDSVRENLSAHPPGLLLDLKYLEDPAAGSAPLWLSVGEQAARLQPPVPVAACLPIGSVLTERLERLGARRRLTVDADLEEVRAALNDRRPSTDQIRLKLAPEPIAAAVVRDLIRAACQEWHLETLLPRAQLVVSELVGNSVEHAGTYLDFVVTRLGPLRRGIVRGPSRLRVSVYGRDPQLPRLPAPELSYTGPHEQRGYGLRIVEAAARSWGALPTPDGKVVWAVLHDDTPVTPAPRR
ncbi:ATP-binding protein [Actinoplanes sp. L3-i22]|uniref:ATP-binding protein n=1 Tax=Actinoplanes sp. L3-i22 TaxID=2836373 RepID=UPI001C8659C9|nr:ATP-binding protein [Actinoplanes sp. L3-i22]